MHNMMHMHPGIALGIVMVIFGLVLVLVLLFVHFLPSYLAFQRKHPYRLAILLLNIFLGWTLIAWVILLLWALASPPAVAAPPPYLPPGRPS
jgi:hypothetical protein